MVSPRALIAEDEHLLAAAMTRELATVWPELQIEATVGDGLSAIEQGLALKPDLCFLDIRMPGCDGLQAAQALAEDWPDGTPLPLLVFVTAYDQYALKAFEAQAVDYLVKPVNRPRLEACVQRLKQRLAERQVGLSGLSGQPLADTQQATLDQLRALLQEAGLRGAGAAASPGAERSAPASRLEVIQAQTGSTVHFVPVADVIYFEAADKYVRVVTAQKEHLIRLPLKDLLEQLDPQQWWQIHRGTIVQARCISKAVRDESGKAFINLHGRPETLTASRLYAHRFKGL